MMMMMMMMMMMIIIIIIIIIKFLFALCMSVKHKSRLCILLHSSYIEVMFVKTWACVVF